MTEEKLPSHNRKPSLVLFLISALLLLYLYAIGQVFFKGYVLDLGSLGIPNVRYTYFLTQWIFFGTLAGALLASAASFLLSGTKTYRLVERWERIPDKGFLIAASVLGLLFPILVRVFVLQGAPLTDDESCYQFSAELLASGRLYTDSPPLKLFFDRAFMINNGRLYSQYFLGWPALMVPGVWLGIVGYMNAIYSALTVPAIFLSLRRMVGSSWAKLGVVLYLTSPMLMVGAATKMSHTTCMMALAWTLWFTLRACDEDSPSWSHAGVSFFFSLAFFIRPTCAIGIGAPMLVYWLLGQRKREQSTLTALVWFAVPATVMASLFLAVNYLQNGSITSVAYQKIFEYTRMNGYRFRSFSMTSIPKNMVHNFDFSNPMKGLSLSGIALVRMNAALFGWPLSLVFVLLAGWKKRAGLLLASVICFFLVHGLISDVGVDSFAPVHFFELALPFLLLTVLGLQRSTATLLELTTHQDEQVKDSAPTTDADTEHDAEAAPAQTTTEKGSLISHPLTVFPSLFMMVFVFLSLTGYVPIRFRALYMIGKDINTPFQAVKKQKLKRAVVFATMRFTKQCVSKPTKHFLYWRPNNDPALKNDILWVNHLDVLSDKRLMKHFPARKGYVMQWKKDCTVHYLPLAPMKPGAVPKGWIGGNQKGLDPPAK